MGDVERARDFLDVHHLALEREGGVARDHEQRRDLRQIGDDVLGDAVAEIFLLRIAAHVDERKHADRHALRLLRFGGRGNAGRGLVAGGLRDRFEQIAQIGGHGVAGPVGQLDRVELAEPQRRTASLRLTGTSRPLSRPSAASSCTQADSTDASDHSTTTASALLSSRSISLEKREPPWMWRSHQTSWPAPPIPSANCLAASASSRA